jgi:hypothetical protein
MLRRVYYLAPVANPDPERFPLPGPLPVFRVVAADKISDRMLTANDWRWGRVEIKVPEAGNLTRVVAFEDFTKPGRRDLLKLARAMVNRWESANPGADGAEAFVLLATREGRDGTDLWRFPAIETAALLKHGPGAGGLLEEIQRNSRQDSEEMVTYHQRDRTG